MSGDSDTRWTQQRSGLIKYVQSKLLVRHLQTILKKLALPVSGLKVAQQARLIDQIDKVIEARNDEGLQQLKRLIYNPDSPDTHASPGPSTAAAPRPAQLPPKTPGYTSHSYSPSGLYSPLLSPAPPVMSPASTPSLEFYPSPFYEPIASLTTIHGLQAFGPVTTTSRSIVNIPIQLTQQHADRVRDGLRTILYCAEGTTSVTYHHVAFPQQIEIRVNGKIISANLRGLKNKPGTTRPLDVTEHIDKTPGFKNNIMVTYALSQKRYLAIVKLVRKSTPENLVAQIKARPHISKQAVLDRLRKDFEDDEIVATSSVMSLKCPASTLRIVTPIRSQFCKHNQCYDAISFLQLQEQAPTWNCPVCSKKIEFADLAVDKYVEEILNSVSRDVEAVVVDPMGQWTVRVNKESSPHIKRDRDSDDSDDESENEISILDAAPPGFRSSANGLHTPSTSTPNHYHNPIARPTHLSTPKSLSSEPLASSSARPNGGSSSKRPLPVTIDLTLSDDDDVRPPPPKRHQTSATPTPLSHQKQADNTSAQERVKRKRIHEEPELDSDEDDDDPLPRRPRFRRRIARLSSSFDSDD